MDLQAGSRQHIELGSIQRQVKRCRDITLRRPRCVPCGRNERHMGGLTVIGRLVERKIVDIDQVVNWVAPGGPPGGITRALIMSVVERGDDGCIINDKVWLRSGEPSGSARA